MIAEASTIQKPGRRRSSPSSAWSGTSTTRSGTASCWRTARSKLRPHVVHILKTLDERGILHSIASRNDHDLGDGEAQGARDRRVLPLPADQLELQGRLGGADRPGHQHRSRRRRLRRRPAVRARGGGFLPRQGPLSSTRRCLDDLLDRPELNPRFITEDSRLRRRMYQADIARNREEAEYVGPKEEFLATLGMVFTIAPCREEDLKRAEELTVRTNQLNTTGYTYSYEELDELRQFPAPRAAHRQPGGPARHLRQDRPVAGGEGRGGLDAQAPPDVLPGDVQGRGHDPAPPHPARRQRRPVRGCAPSSSPTTATARC